MQHYLRFLLFFGGQSFDINLKTDSFIIAFLKETGENLNMLFSSENSINALQLSHAQCLRIMNRKIPDYRLSSKCILPVWF